MKMGIILLPMVIVIVVLAVMLVNQNSECTNKGGVLVKGFSLTGYVCLTKNQMP